MKRPSTIGKLINKLVQYQKEYKEIRREESVKYFSSDMRRNCEHYLKFYESEKVDPKIILYESYWGRGMVDNPFALFKVMINDSRCSDMLHVWVLDDSEKDDFKVRKYRGLKNVIFVERDSDDYYKYLASAGYLICNVTFPSLFIKKPGQTYINTWHGTPLKKMGYEMAGGNYGSRNMVRNFLHADYLVASNDILQDMYLVSYKMENIMPGKIIKEGYPRNDLLFNTSQDDIFDELEYYGVEFDRSKKIILYAPTWKQTDKQDVIIDADDLIDFKAELEAKIDADNYQVLIKPHQHLYEKVKDREDFKGKMIPTSIDTNELLSAVDILISDYSSIFFDYMALDRPILFYIKDLEEYTKSRGLNMDIDSLPGPICDNIEGLAECIRDLNGATESYKDAYKAMKERICPHDDGKASERVADCLLGDPEKYDLVGTTFNKKRLLISLGLLRENGITNSALSLLKQIDYDKYDVTLFTTLDQSVDNLVKRLNKDVDPHVRVMVKIGVTANTAKEEALRLFIENRGLEKEYWKKKFPWHSIQREYRRLFGGAEFDYAVDFNGYGMLNAVLICSGNARRKALWLHNDIYADMHRTVNGEQPLLKGMQFIISLHPKFDALVSCGKSVMEVNRKNLATEETKDRFRYAKNTTNADRVRALICEEPFVSGKDYLIKEKTIYGDKPSHMLLIPAPDPSYTNFVTMGRMSTEKNHLKLIGAFAEYLKKYPDSRLYIIGAGPLQNKIENKIKKLKIEDKVVLTGLLYNPFAVMKRCDCFILPSIHEGQPMVLLEARQCGLPIIVSDFSSVKDSLFPDGQYVIHSDEESIYEGLVAFREGKVPKCDFDVDAYNREAYEEFINAVCGTGV